MASEATLERLLELVRGTPDERKVSDALAEVRLREATAGRTGWHGVLASGQAGSWSAGSVKGRRAREAARQSRDRFAR